MISKSPKSSPYLAQDCKVFATASNLNTASFYVSWNGVAPFSGTDPNLYIIRVRSGNSTVKEIVVNEIDESNEYGIEINNLLHGELYEINIVAENEVGTGAPSWFADIDSNDGSLTQYHRDYESRSCFAIPTCNELADDCHESLAS